jgi:uncharacterized protein (DUF1330 family)
MTVYIINNMTVHDQEEYRKYVKDFMPIFEHFGGKVLAVQNAPSAVEGTWPFDRTVLLSFPTREAALQWSNSPQYKAIAVHRRAGTRSNVVILDALPPLPAPDSASADEAPSPARFPGKNVVHCISVERESEGNTLVLHGVIESGIVAAGMLLYIPFNSTLGMSVRIVDVRLQPGSVSLVLECEGEDEVDFVEGMNLVGDRLEVLVDEAHGRDR